MKNASRVHSLMSSSRITAMT